MLMNTSMYLIFIFCIKINQSKYPQIMNLRVLLSDCRYPVHGPCLTSSDRIHPLVSVRRSHIVHRLGALVVRLSAGRPGGAQSSS